MSWRLLSSLIVLVSALLGSVCGSETYLVPPEHSYLKFVGSAYGWDRSYPDGGDDNTKLLGYWGGGEFKFEIYSDYENGQLTGPLGYFVTFCAERGEYIAYNNIYYYESTRVSESPFADWIYYGYLTNEEYGNVVPDRVSSATENRLDTYREAADVQDALWRALGQNNPGWSNDVWDSWQAAYQADTDWLNNDRSLDTKVAVLKTVWGTEAQDQFVYVSREGDDMLPEPASLLIWLVLGLGSSGLAVWSGRRNNALSESGSARWSRENRDAILSLIERGRRV